MTGSRIEAASLALVLAAGVLILLLATPTGFGYVTTIGGLILLFVILAYDQEGARSVFQSLAYAATAAFPLMIAIGILFQISVNRAGDITPAARQDFLQVRLAITWVFATIFLWAIDRARMGSRVSTESVPKFSTVRRTLAPDYGATGATAPAPPRATAPVQPEPTQINLPTPQTYVEQPPVETPPTQTREPPAQAAPPTGAIPIKGKEATIYVNLLGEGINLLRPVRAENLGRDFYRIVEAVPDGETWEFGPGQVVRCQKRKLSTGKAMVAIEEAPRAQ
jgi:hypothetical protein